MNLSDRLWRTASCLTALMLVPLSAFSGGEALASMSPFAFGQEQLPMPKFGVAAPKLAAMKVVQGKALPKFEKGTVYVLEFWATWCGPCVGAIAHINELATQFKGKPVEFYSITQEAPNDLVKFMKKYPFAGSVLSDASGGTFSSFGIQVIPRTAIIDQNGKLLAITSPERVTSDVLQKVLAKQPVQIATAFNKVSSFDWDKELTKGSLAHVLILPSESDGGGSRMAPGSGQLTADGMSLKNLVSRIYSASFFDMKWEYEPEAFKYRVSVRAPDHKEATALKLLSDVADQMFDYVAAWEMIERDVVVISKTGDKLKMTPTKGPTKGPSNEGFAHGGEIVWPNCDMKTLATLFQDFMYGKTAVDETGDAGRYDVHLKWVPGDKASIEEMLTLLGLKVTKTQRTVRTLVVRQKPVQNR